MSHDLILFQISFHLMQKLELSKDSVNTSCLPVSLRIVVRLTHLFAVD